MTLYPMVDNRNSFHTMLWLKQLLHSGNPSSKQTKEVGLTGFSLYQGS